jgi:hypothetical protein
MDALYQQEGKEGFPEAWFRHHGHTQAAEQVAAWNERRREASEGDNDAAPTLALRGAE